MAAPATIYALSTAPGRAAIAVIRISGPQAVAALKQLAGRVPSPRRAQLAVLRHPQTRDILDQALILYFQAPATETGEDLVELQIHGGRAVTRAVFQAIACIPGCRPAEAGEFAHRAFINGKMDLTAAEGLADLIDAETEAQRHQAIMLATGRHAQMYDNWRARLIECQALVESAIDFSDEGDVSAGALDLARPQVDSLCAELKSHLSLADRGEIIRDGFRVVIAGPPNAGKSTLLNTLAQREAAIVSDEAGTTRDAIEVHLDLDGLAVIITDTAGIRPTEAKVELEGIRRTFDRARQANLVIWLTDINDTTLPPKDLVPASIPVLRIANKSDLQEQSANLQRDPNIRISAATSSGIDELTKLIVSHARDRIGEVAELAPTSARQAYHLRDAQRYLSDYLAGSATDIELRAEDLRLAADSLGRLTGRIDAEDVLDQIFYRFCIGK